MYFTFYAVTGFQMKHIVILNTCIWHSTNKHILITKILQLFESEALLSNI
jgi:hypothetical protein